MNKVSEAYRRIFEYYISPAMIDIRVMTLFYTCVRAAASLQLPDLAVPRLPRLIRQDLITE